MFDDTWQSPIALSGRELDVVRLIATGLSSKEAAQRLSIAPRTVEHYLEQARLKTRSRNRTHMVAKAIYEGLVVSGGEAGRHAFGIGDSAAVSASL
jgi:DNA-binding CsgD family transcriptional regulator